MSVALEQKVSLRGWREARLGELIHIKHGYAFKGEYFSDSGPFVVLTPGNFYDEGGFKDKGDKEKRYVGEVPKDFILKQGDLLIAMTEQAEGLLGSSAIVPSDDLYLHNQRLGLVTEINKARIDRRFLYYLFNTRLIRQRIRASASGTKVRHTSPSRIYELSVSVPPFSVQRWIGQMLSGYDELIENNTRRIKILEGMAQALYRAWFVHFRFPGHETIKLADSSLGKIPSGWGIKRLADICGIVMGQSPKSEYYNDTGVGLPFHQGVTDFGDRFPVDRVYCTVENRIAEKDDILCSVRAPVGRLNISTKRIVIGRGLCAIRCKTGEHPFVFQQLKEKFREEDTMGGGTIFKSVTKDDMHGIKTLWPAESIRGRYDQCVAPMFCELENLTLINSNLRRTRDLLLPKLISGELSVPPRAQTQRRNSHARRKPHAS